MTFASCIAQIVALLLLTAGSSAMAQTDSVSFFKKYELETIYLGGNGYIKNNQSFKLRNLSNEFNFTAQGLKGYQAYRADRKKFIVTYSIGLGLLIGGLIYENNKQTSNLLVPASFVPITFSLHFAIRSQNRLSKAIWIRNRDVLLAK
jgi:hypothetical protein